MDLHLLMSLVIKLIRILSMEILQDLQKQLSFSLKFQEVVWQHQELEPMHLKLDKLLPLVEPHKLNLNTL